MLLPKIRNPKAYNNRWRSKPVFKCVKNHFLSKPKCVNSTQANYRLCSGRFEPERDDWFASRSPTKRDYWLLSPHARDSCWKRKKHVVFNAHWLKSGRKKSEFFSGPQKWQVVEELGRQPTCSPVFPFQGRIMVPTGAKRESKSLKNLYLELTKNHPVLCMHVCVKHDYNFTKIYI